MVRNDNTPKFKRNESFSIRDGWFEKAINSIKENEGVNVFSKNHGIETLGIGANMVKSLKYWLQSANLIESNFKQTSLTEFGNLVYNHDRYLESDFVWFLIHYFLSTNYVECPVFYAFFNTDIKSTKKEEFTKFLSAFFQMDGYDNVRMDYLEDDANVMFKSYLTTEVSDNPEDNSSCPLSSLKLIQKRGDKLEKRKPVYSALSYLIVYFALGNKYGFKPFNIEDSFVEPLSPYLLFNLDKNMYFQYLEEMRRNGFVTINKTAGLNTVYFNKKMTLTGVFDMWFRSK